MTTEINHQMVELARHTRGFTQSDLAEKAGIAQGTLSKIERGLMLIDDDLLNKLSNALEYPPSFFEQEGGIHYAGIKYRRARSKLSSSLRNKIDAENNIRARAIRELFKPFELEVCDIPELSVDKYGTAERVANALREYWRIPRGPIADLSKLLESKGIFVIQANFYTDQFDGVTYQFPDSVPSLIFLNKDFSGDRMRFTLAHELGHMIMHNVPVDTKQAEDEANRFASEFMAPADEVKPYLYKMGLEELISLKKYWGMSMAFFAYKAFKLKTISLRQYKYLVYKIKTVSNGKQEPEETAIPKENSHLVDQMIHIHKTELNYSDQELSDALKLRLSDFHQLFDVERPIAKVYKLNNA